MFTVATAVMTVLIATNDLGVILGVVRWPGDHREVAPTATTIALTSSSVLALGSILLAGPFTELMGSPESAGILRLISLTLVLDGIVAVPTALLLRGFRQDQLAKAELTAIPVGIGLAVGLALAGAGPWALAVSRLGGAAVTVVMVLARTPGPASARLEPRGHPPARRLRAPCRRHDPRRGSAAQHRLLHRRCGARSRGPRLLPAGVQHGELAHQHDEGGHPQGLDRQLQRARG